MVPAPTLEMERSATAGIDVSRTCVLAELLLLPGFGSITPAGTAADAVFVKAATGIRLEVGDASLEMRADGTVLINGTVVQIVGSTSVDLNP